MIAVPQGCRRSARMLPWCASMNPLQIDNPSPGPPVSPILRPRLDLPKTFAPSLSGMPSPQQAARALKTFWRPFVLFLTPS